MTRVSTESSDLQRTRAVSDDSRSQPGDDEEITRQRNLWWAVSISEVLTLASSWVAFWLTVEVLSADIGFSEQNPLASALLDWSTMALALSVLGVLVVAMGLLRLARITVQGRGTALMLAVGSGAVAAVSLIDVVWNLLLLNEFGGFSAVGAPGPAAAVFALGVLAYLGAVHWLSHNRWSDRVAGPTG
jgi:hypothetical protein